MLGRRMGQGTDVTVVIIGCEGKLAHGLGCPGKEEYG